MLSIFRVLQQFVTEMKKRKRDFESVKPPEDQGMGHEEERLVYDSTIIC